MEPSPLPTAHLEVHANFINLRAKLGTAVDRCIRLVSIGFKASLQPIDSDIRLPGSGLSFSGSAPWSDTEARQHYTSWLFAIGLRDVLESFGTFLDECYEIASFLELARKQQKNKSLSQQNLNDRNEATAKFRRLFVEKKVRRLKSALGALPPDFEELILPINCARNILAHHDGIIPETFLDANGLFRINWRRLTMLALGPDQREVRAGEVLKAGEGLGLGVALDVLVST